MDRNDKMEMRIKIQCVVAMLLSLLPQSCSDPEPKREDFIGVWKSDDGAVIELRIDGVYSAKQINYYNYDSEKEYENRRLDFTGRWEIVNEEKKLRLKLQSNATFKDFGINRTYTVDGQVYSHKIGLTFDIAGQGLLEDKPPWHLFVWIGDPDNVDKYKFEKQ